MSLSKLSLTALALAGSALAGNLPSITAKGSKFFYPNGTQFFIKGVAYQQDVGAAGTGSTGGNSTFIDPLASPSNCKRDIPLLQQLGTNTIRTYAIDPTADHSECMQMLNDAGIYVVSDLSEPSLSINRNTPSWNTELFTRYQKVIDEMMKYPNVIGFFAGNEVSNAKNNTGASAYVKAAVRDTKAYLKTKSRWAGVGYAANDDVDIRDEIADYFNCGNQTDAIDFWGYNIYSWCGQSDPQKSGYAEQTTFFSNYSVPVFFAEYGCNNPGGAAGRIFQETAALYGPDMSKVFSGGIVYMFFEEENDFGLVQVSGSSVTKLKDFAALATQVNKADPSGVQSSSYSPSNKPAACPQLTDEWQANSALPPTPDQSLCTCMQQSRSCVRADNLDTKDYGDIFGFICGKDASLCVGISGNSTTGVYGAYSMCDAGAQLDYVLDAYYKDNGNSADACSFNSQAQVVKPQSVSKCSAALASASAVNSQAATATTPVGGAHASSTGASDSFAVHGAPIARLFSIGDLAIGAYMGVAMLAGAAMVAL